MIAPFQTRPELVAWLAARGVSHLARVALDAAAPLVEPALRPRVRGLGARRRLVELAHADGVLRAADWLVPAGLHPALPEAVWACVQAAAEDAALARAQVPERLRPPAPRSPAAALHARLVELRSRFPASVAPRLDAALPAPGSLALDPELPGFRLDDPLPFEPAHAAGRYGPSRAALVLSGGGPARVECSCGPEPCVHALALVDAALRWTHTPPSEALEAAVSALGRPPWERALRALERVLDEPAEARAGFELRWALHVTDGVGVEVVPWMTKRGKGGREGAPVRLSRARLRLELGARLSAEDARVAALLAEDGALAPRPLLDALVGHPRVFDGDAPGRAVKVERAPLGLAAEDRGGALRLCAALDGAPLPPGLAERVRRARPDDVLFVWDGVRLALLDVAAPLHALLGVLHREGDLIPPEGRDALLQTLSRWAQHVPVALPRGALGERVAAALQPLLRFGAAGAGAGRRAGAMSVELRVRPLEGGPSFLPGDGPRDVYARRGADAFHAVRAPLAELEAAARCRSTLGLGEPVSEALPHEFHLAGPP